jgi:hypothetical protein
MRARIGILDMAAVAMVAVVILLPARIPKVEAAHPAMDAATRRGVASLQAELLATPDDGEVAERLAELLTEAGYSDWALRIAGEASRAAAAPTRWQALRALSTTHADRVELAEALRWAREALAACEAEPSCPAHEALRLSLYAEQLEAGLASGIDPRADPEGFRDAIGRAGIRQIRLKQMSAPLPGAPAGASPPALERGAPVPSLAPGAAPAPGSLAPSAADRADAGH